MTDLSRRSLITGLIALGVTAPAIVRAGSLMPVKVMEPVGYLSQIIIEHQEGDLGVITSAEVRAILFALSNGEIRNHGNWAPFGPRYGWAT